MNGLAFVLQARIGSTRLPNKMVLPFYEEKSVFEILLEKLTTSFPNIPIILATSDKPENQQLVDIANSMGVLTYQGDENDVLKRFIDAAKYHHIDKLIRICSDNPFLDMNELARLVSFVAENQEYDYVSFKVNGKPTILSHFGFWTEYVTLDALKRVCTMTNDMFYHEHVTNYVYNNTETFKVHLLEVDKALEGRQDIRMTLDTKEDFDVLALIYADLQKQNNKNIHINDLVSYIDNNIDYREKMKNQINLNTK